MENGAVRREHRSMARAVPCSVRIVPGDRAALVRAFGRQPVIAACLVAEHGKLLAVLGDYAALAGLDIRLALDDRLAVAVLVEILGYRAAGIIELLPGAFALEDEIGDHYSGCRAIGDAPAVESRRDEIAWRFLGIRYARHGNPIECVVIFVAPP